MNTLHGTIRLRARGPLLIGGQTPAPPGTDASTAVRDEHRARAFIPASTLKGALREAVERRLRSEGGPSGACVPEARCPAASPCRACRLFGVAGPDRPLLTDEAPGVAPRDVALSGIRLGDALPAPEDAPPLRVRKHVAIDRYSGRASEQRLFDRQVAEANGRIFTAPFEAVGLSPEDLSWLAETARLVVSLGNSQSRGHGRVDVEAVETAQRPPAPAVVVHGDLRPSDAARVVVTAREPLHLGAVPDPTSLRASLGYIPGAAIRGALVTAAASAGLQGVVAALADPSFHVSDLLPFPKDDSRDLSFPAPRSALGCSNCRVVADHLLREAVVRALGARLRFPAGAATCPGCDRPLKPLTGWRMHGGKDVALRSRVVTRLARDPRTGSYAEGMLFAREQVEPGSRFAGTLRATPDALRALRDLASSGATVRVGGLRRRGLGSVEVAFDRLHRDPVARLRDFQAAAARDLAGAPADLGWDPRRLVPVLARTPLAFAGGPGEAPARIAEALFGDPRARLVAAWQRHERRSGWDSEVDQGPRGVLPVVKAGCVWLFEGGEADRLPAAVLREAEVEGIGEFRELGLGRVWIRPEV